MSNQMSVCSFTKANNKQTNKHIRSWSAALAENDQRGDLNAMQTKTTTLHIRSKKGSL